MAEWRNIEGFPNYSVSDDGQIRNDSNGKILKPWKMKNGYYAYSLRCNGATKHVTVHRILATTFIPNPEGKRTVNHINGIKTDNRLVNLEWATYHENNLHAYRVLDSSKRRLEQSIRQKGKKHSPEWARKIGESESISVTRLDDGKVYKSITEAARDMNGYTARISEVCKGKRKSAYGYRWSYTKEVTNARDC